MQRFRRNYDYVAAALGDLPAIAIQQPVAPGAYLGEAFVFRVPDAQWFARALRCEGIDADNLGCDQDSNVRVYWNWWFLFDGEEPAAISGDAPEHNPVHAGSPRRPIAPPRSRQRTATS